MNHDEDLAELDRIWPMGKMLDVPDGGTVLVAGAYKGRYMDYVASRYKPARVLGFEPQPQAVAVARARLERHGDIIGLSAHGLGVHDCLVTMDEFGTDGCKVSTADRGHAVRFVGIDSVLDTNKKIDLFICNAEGYEVPLLGYLLASGKIGHIASLAVQFHSKAMRPALMLNDHYSCPVYDDFPTWCFWRKK